MVQEVPEDPVVRVAQEVPADQEDREVTYQNTLHLLNILYFLLEDYVTVFLDLSGFSIEFLRFLFKFFFSSTHVASHFSRFRCCCFAIWIRLRYSLTESEPS